MSDVIAAYAIARALPIPQGQANVMRLELEGGDSVVLEARGNTVRVYRIHALPFPTEAQLMAALTRCDARHGHGVQVGLRGSGNDAALFMIKRLHDAGPDPTHIDRALDTLQRWHAAWLSACNTF